MPSPESLTETCGSPLNCPSSLVHAVRPSGVRSCGDPAWQSATRIPGTSESTSAMAPQSSGISCRSKLNPLRPTSRRPSTKRGSSSRAFVPVDLSSSGARPTICRTPRTVGSSCIRSSSSPSRSEVRSAKTTWAMGQSGCASATSCTHDASAKASSAPTWM